MNSQRNNPPRLTKVTPIDLYMQTPVPVVEDFLNGEGAMTRDRVRELIMGSLSASFYDIDQLNGARIFYAADTSLLELGDLPQKGLEATDLPELCQRLQDIRRMVANVMFEDFGAKNVFLSVGDPASLLVERATERAGKTKKTSSDHRGFAPVEDTLIIEGVQEVPASAPQVPATPTQAVTRFQFAHTRFSGDESAREKLQFLRVEDYPGFIAKLVESERDGEVPPCLPEHPNVLREWIFQARPATPHIRFRRNEDNRQRPTLTVAPYRADFRTLEDRKSDLNELGRLYVLRDILRGLEHIHESGFVHMDIKSGNIRILEERETGRPFAQIFDHETAKRRGAPLRSLFFTPDCYESSYYDRFKRGQLASSKMDVFALGALSMALFQDSKYEDVVDQLKLVTQLLKNSDMQEEDSSYYEFAQNHLSKFISNPALVRLILEMLNPDHKNRPSAKQVLVRVEEILQDELENTPHSQNNGWMVRPQTNDAQSNPTLQHAAGNPGSTFVF